MKRKIIFMLMLAVIVFAVSGCGDAVQDMLETCEVNGEITFGAYEQDNDMTNGAEPIEWLVLDKTEEKVLVISKYALDCIPYDAEGDADIWENCSLREWLNQDFIGGAFSEDELARICETVNENKGVNDYSISDQADTTDRVFLLSMEEVGEYFKQREDTPVCEESIVFPTEYAKAKGAETRKDGAVLWWLRSCLVEKQRGTGYAACVDDLGKRFARAREPERTDVGVRPVMWISIEAK